VIAYFILEPETFIGLMVAIVTILIMGAMGGGIWLSSNDWYIASTYQEVWDRANMLHDYVEDLVRRNPNLTLVSEQSWWHEALEHQNEELQEEIQDIRNDLRHSKELLQGLETPSQFEVSEQVLDRLSSLERTRLLEAIQAYRVNAWTPSAATCGMILEGWLKRLCHDNGIRPGGMRAMIVRLGEAGLLHGYYDKLAQIGEFFRHRATHPTTEEFDREKATLILTSLVLLIRDLF
jgi:hypothetical protein